MQTTINNFLSDFSSHPRWTHFKAEVSKKLNSELSRIKDSIGQEKWALAEKNYNELLKTLTVAQKQLDHEIKKTLKTIKKSASEVEKTLAQYKTIAIKQKAKAKKQVSAKKTVGTQKASSPKKASKVSKSGTTRKKTTKA